uniref:Uncharacterized protein n=1 Tax=Anguilla anguilla TaxID=7936 RepID=A0A0E9U7E0_ANGAN
MQTHNSISALAQGIQTQAYCRLNYQELAVTDGTNVKLVLRV